MGKPKVRSLSRKINRRIEVIIPDPVGATEAECRENFEQAKNRITRELREAFEYIPVRENITRSRFEIAAINKRKN